MALNPIKAYELRPHIGSGSLQLCTFIFSALCRTVASAATARLQRLSAYLEYPHLVSRILELIIDESPWASAVSIRDHAFRLSSSLFLAHSQPRSAGKEHLYRNATNGLQRRNCIRGRHVQSFEQRSPCNTSVFSFKATWN